VDLAGLARQHWLDNAKILHAAGLLAVVGLGALEDLCVNYAIFQAAADDCLTRGTVLKGGKVNPAARVALRVSALCNKARDALGDEPDRAHPLRGARSNPAAA
jgi:phage terminase small subunit